MYVHESGRGERSRERRRVCAQACRHGARGRATSLSFGQLCPARRRQSARPPHTHRGPRPPPSAEPAKKLFNTLCLAQGALEFAGSFASSPGPGPHPTGPGSRTRLKAPRQAPRPDLRNHRPPLHADAGNRPSHRHLRLTSPTPFLPVFLVREKKAGYVHVAPPIKFQKFYRKRSHGRAGPFHRPFHLGPGVSVTPPR